MTTRTKLTAKLLTDICDTMASGMLSYEKAGKLNGTSGRSMWNWIRRSQDGDESLIINYLGEDVPFHRALIAARRCALHEARGRMEQKSILGYDEPVFFNGQPTFKLDLRTIGWDPEERTALGFRADGLLEVNGQVVQNTVHHEPPIALQLRVAEMAFPKEYRPGVNSSVDVNHSGVVGIRHAAPTNYRAGPPPIPPMPVPPMLEVLTEIIPEALDPGDVELDDMLGPDEAYAETPQPDMTVVSTVDEPDEVFAAAPLPPLPPAEPEIRDMPTARETPTPQPANSILGPTPKNIPPAWRDEWQKLTARVVPDKVDRKASQ